MTDPRLGPRDPLSAEDVAAVVSAIRSDWVVLDFDPMPDGSDGVYGVTVRDATGRRRSTVLKCFRDAAALSHRTPERFLVEVDLLELAGRETGLPVPAVHGACGPRDGVPSPAFLTERLAGEHPVWIDDADGDRADRLLREAGRHLARIHELRSFDEFGDLVAGDAPSEAGAGDAVAGSGAGEPVVADGRERWRDRLRDLVGSALDDLDGMRFADLEADLRTYADERFAALDLDADAALLHGDYRPGNLLADPDTGAVSAILDWGAAQAGDPRYELAWAVREFAGRAQVGSDARRRVRDALFDGYQKGRGSGFERDDAFERRQSFYLAVTWLLELQRFDVWWAGADEAVRSARAERLRENVRSLR